TIDESSPPVDGYPGPPSAGDRGGPVSEIAAPVAEREVFGVEGAQAATLPGDAGPVSDALAATVADEPQGTSSATKRPAPTSPGYEILGELGRGGMGVVYRARQLQLHRECALKLILGGAHANPVAAARFLTEAAAIARLQTPNIIQIYHIGEVDGLPFL